MSALKASLDAVRNREENGGGTATATKKAPAKKAAAKKPAAKKAPAKKASAKKPSGTKS
jgi:hypothetical protein